MRRFKATKSYLGWWRTDYFYINVISEYMVKVNGKQVDIISYVVLGNSGIIRNMPLEKFIGYSKVKIK